MTNAAPALTGLEDLLDLGHGGGIDMRPTLLRVLTDLYLQRSTHTPEDEGYYTELALRLIDAVEIPERAALATRLATFPSAPRPVLMRLARDVIEVAAPILAHSPCLTAADLGAVTDACGRSHAELIAARPMAPAAAAAAATRSAKAEAAELTELFYAAGAQERRLILINLDYAMIAPSQPAFAMQRTDIWRLESAALQHNSDAVVRELERALGISHTQARRIMSDELGEPIVVAAKALELPSDVLQRMLLFMNPHVGQSVDRVFELAELYREISTKGARRLIAIWRTDTGEHTGPRREAAHQSIHQSIPWRTAAENARRALSEVSRRPELQNETRRRGRSGA